MSHNAMSIEIVDSPDKAPHYRRDTPDVRTVSIDKAIVVLKGTVSGKSTVDFQITAQDGSQFIAMLSGAIVKNLAAVIEGAESR